MLLHVSIQSSQYELCVCCSSTKQLFTVQRHYTSDIILLVDCSMTSLLLVLVSISVPPSLPPSVHPSSHLAEVRSGRPRRVEWSEGWSDSWSPVRQGETNYPSNESHSSSLHLSLLSSLSSSTPLREIQRTWMATPGKKIIPQTSTTQLYT